MTDPVLRDLDRHLARIDHDNAIDIRAESLRESDPDEYGDMDEEELRGIAERDLQDRAEEAAIEAYLDGRNFPGG